MSVNIQILGISLWEEGLFEGYLYTSYLAMKSDLGFDLKTLVLKSKFESGRIFHQACDVAYFMFLKIIKYKRVAS